jgi:hypothetical protein
MSLRKATGKSYRYHFTKFSPKRSISPEGHSPWKRSKIISEEFDKITYQEMGRVSGEVARESNMLERSYKDPVKKHLPKLANRYSLDFGDTTGKFLSRIGPKTPKPQNPIFLSFH